MNDREARLGKFETQFFAWTQLRKKSLVATGDIATALGLTPKQERELLSRMARAGFIVRIRNGLYMVPSQIPPGGKWTPGEYKLARALMEDAGANYQIVGPTAFHQHGLDEQVPNNITIYNDKISGRRLIGGIEFILVKVARQRLGGVDDLKLPDGTQVKISGFARTLMDAVYDWDRFNTLPRAYNWIRAQKNNSEVISELVQLTIQHGNSGTRRRIGCLLEAVCIAPRLLNKLKAELTKTRSLIPFVPTLPDRGDINRDWGVIVNEEI
jgi:predicted transcriptional regulator of viral defense system